MKTVSLTRTTQGSAMHSNRMLQQRKVAALFRRRGPNTFKKGAAGTGRRIAGHEPHANGSTNWTAIGALTKARKVRRWRADPALIQRVRLTLGRLSAIKRATRPMYAKPEQCLFDLCWGMGSNKVGNVPRQVEYNW